MSSGPPGDPRRHDPLDLLLLGPEPARDGRVARQVEALADGDDRRQRHVVDLPAAGRLAAHGGGGAARPSSALAPVTIGRSSAAATRMPTWNPPESADSLPNRMRSNGPLGGLARADRLDQRGRRGDGIPVAAVGLEQDGPLDPDGHRVAQLVRRPRPARASGPSTTRRSPRSAGRPPRPRIPRAG